MALTMAIQDLFSPSGSLDDDFGSSDEGDAGSFRCGGRISTKGGKSGSSISGGSFAGRKTSTIIPSLTNTSRVSRSDFLFLFMFKPHNCNRFYFRPWDPPRLTVSSDIPSMSAPVHRRWQPQRTTFRYRIHDLGNLSDHRRADRLAQHVAGHPIPGWCSSCPDAGLPYLSTFPNGLSIATAGAAIQTLQLPTIITEPTTLRSLRTAPTHEPMGHGAMRSSRSASLSFRAGPSHVRTAASWLATDGPDCRPRHVRGPSRCRRFPSRGTVGSESLELPVRPPCQWVSSTIRHGCAGQRRSTYRAGLVVQPVLLVTQKLASKGHNTSASE